jgi:serine protease AprX
MLHFLLLACILSPAVLPADAQQDKATRWFQEEVWPLFLSEPNDTTQPRIYGVDVAPSAIKRGDPRAEINAFIYDPAGVEIAYAEVGERMNLMLDLDRDGRYTGYCGSNLFPGTYRVAIVAIDRAGNAARKEAMNFTVIDPLDLNANHIEDTLERQSSEELRVIVLHEGNLSGPVNDRFKILPASSMTVPGSRLEELSKLRGVKGIYKDQKLKLLGSPGVSSSPVKVVDDPRRGHARKGEGVTVALLDTGADAHHQSFDGPEGDPKIAAFKDFVNNQSFTYDDNGHGTHCASLIAGTGEMAGVAPGAKLVVVKVMDQEGACYLSDAIKALDWCLENKDRYGIRVVSFSVGGESPLDGSSLLDDACNRMVDKGLVMCVAAGNSGPAPASIVVPGGAQKVITVGAVDRRGAIFDRSSRGPAADGETKPDLVTIGVDVVSATAGTRDGYSSMSGTSMAVPQVAGGAALLLEAGPRLAPADVKRILLKTADDLDFPGPDNIFGWGALNLTEALVSLEKKPEKVARPVLKVVELSRLNATVGEPVIIEARVSGDVKDLSSHIVGPGRTLDIPMADLDSNGIYTAWWETSTWRPGSYKIEVELQGRYGEEAALSLPFRLEGKA